MLGLKFTHQSSYASIHGLQNPHSHLTIHHAIHPVNHQFIHPFIYSWRCEYRILSIRKFIQLSTNTVSIDWNVWGGEKEAKTYIYLFSLSKCILKYTGAQSLNKHAIQRQYIWSVIYWILVQIPVTYFWLEELKSGAYISKIMYWSLT